MLNGIRSQGHFLVAAGEDGFYVRVVGLATMNNSTPLQEVLENFQKQGTHSFIFDLASCSGFDSTFMGVLLGIALDKNGNWSTPEGERQTSVLLVNANRSHRKLLAGVGIDRIVRLRPEPIAFPPIELTRLDEQPVDSLRRIRTMVTAHENLVRLGGGNRDSFGVILDMLKRELGGNELPSAIRRARAGSKDPEAES